MKKQLLILLLAFITSISTYAYDFCVDGIYYKINGSEATVTYKNTDYISYSGSVTIPASVIHNGTLYPVTSIGNYAFYKCSGLTSVTIPESVTSIGGYAFLDCSGLTSVSISNSVTSIDYCAFKNCSGLTSMSIPVSVTSIGNQAFYGCSSLTSVTIPNSVTSIGYSAFSHCSGLTSVTIPESVTNINEYTFSGCSGLTSVIISNSVTSIGSGAFSVCSSLTSVTIPNSVTSFGSSAFQNCTSLKAFYGKYASSDNRCLIVDGTLNSFAPYGLSTYSIPNSVTAIGGYAFKGCSGLTSVTIPNSVYSIGFGAFDDCTSLTSVTIGNSVTSIGESAFYDCTGLPSVTIPNSVTTIGNHAFEGCSDLTSVTIGNSVTSIGWNAFKGCSGLTSVTIPNSVASIGWCAFYGCIGLTEVTIPNSVTKIGYSTFYGCSGITSITVENDNPANISLGTNVFYNVPTSTCVLNVPEGSKSLYAAADQWSAFTNIEEFSNVVTLTEGEAYTETEDQDDVDVDYTRTFTDASWQSLYVPFNMSYDEWSPYADVAKIHNIRGYDNDFDGVIDETVLEFSKLTSGELVPNVPYVIRPKETGTVTIECTGKNLLAAPAENGSVDCSSTEFVYALYGVYQPKSFSIPSSAPAKAASTSATPATYTLMNGEFVATEADTEIPAGSIYLAITPKEGGYTPSPAPARIKISVNGEVPTSINTIVSDITIDNACYDLMGRRVENPTRGIYIRGGKKVLVK